LFAFYQPRRFGNTGFVKTLVQNRRPGKSQKVGGFHMDGFAVAAGGERQFGLLGQRFGALHVHVVELAKGRHGAYFALREQVLERLFIGQFNKIGVKNL